MSQWSHFDNAAPGLYTEVISHSNINHASYRVNIENKLGLSCAKLRTSFAELGLA